MRKRRVKSQLEKNIHKVGLFVLGCACFFVDSTHISSASPFDTFKTKNNFATRVPASINQNIFDFDCSKPLAVKEVSTQLETIRLVIKNCAQAPELKNFKLDQKLLAFPIAKTNYSSEFAYLVKGENQFVIKANSQEYKISIFRY
jgi:hypothetical protein